MRNQLVKRSIRVVKVNYLLYRLLTPIVFYLNIKEAGCFLLRIFMSAVYFVCFFNSKMNSQASDVHNSCVYSLAFFVEFFSRGKNHGG